MVYVFVLYLQLQVHIYVLYINIQTSDQNQIFIQAILSYLQTPTIRNLKIFLLELL